MNGLRVACLRAGVLCAALTAVAVGVSPASAASAPGGAVLGWGAAGAATAPGTLAGKTVTAIAAGADHSLALTSDGRITAWGQNGLGQVTLPGTLAGKTVTAIAAGDGDSVALTSAGKVTVWGYDAYGQTTLPAALSTETVTDIAAGGYHALALTAAGQVIAWGDDRAGQASVPAVLSGKTVTAIAAGGSHSLALTSDGEVFAWGENAVGQAAVPAVLSGKTVTAIAAGGFHSLALTSGGQVIAWGEHADGQATVPATLAGRTVTAIAAGWVHSLAIVASEPPLIVANPVDQTVPEGAGVSFTATASGPGTTVQWQQTTDAGATWTNLPGQTANTLTLSGVGSVRNGQRFRAVFTNPDGVATSTAAMLTVAVPAPTVPAPPGVTTSPANRVVTAGSTATFSAAFSGTAATVRWQRSTDDGASWTDLPGQTGLTLTLTNLTAADSGHRFRAVFTNAGGSSTTGAAILMVQEPAAAAHSTTSAAARATTGTATVATTKSTAAPDEAKVAVSTRRLPDTGASVAAMFTWAIALLVIGSLVRLSGRRSRLRR